MFCFYIDFPRSKLIENPYDITNMFSNYFSPVSENAKLNMKIHTNSCHIISIINCYVPLYIFCAPVYDLRHFVITLLLFVIYAQHSNYCATVVFRLRHFIVIFALIRKVTLLILRIFCKIMYDF